MKQPSMLIVYPDGSIDLIRVQPEEYLRFAEYCNTIAGQLLRAYQRQVATTDAPLVQMGFELEK